MRKILALFCLLGIAAVVSCGAVGTGRGGDHTPPTRTPTFTPTSAAGEPTATASPTFTATGEPEPSATPAPNATATATPAPGGNLLANGDFSSGFAGWEQVNGYWGIHDIVGSSCDAENPDWPDYMAEMDRDKCSACNTWPVGGQDWLWQDVTAPTPHDVVTLTLTEAHHMTDAGTAEVSIYGADAGEAWDLIFFRPAPDAPWGVGHHCETPPTFTYSVAVPPGGYEQYRLELHGALIDERDGWIIGPLSLTTE